MSKTRKQSDREFKVMTGELSKVRPNKGVLAKYLDKRPALLHHWR
jgi:transposase